MEHTLTLKITLPNKYNTTITIDEIEENSGESYRMVLSPTLKEFEERVGREIWSWVSTWMDAEEEDEDERDVCIKD